MTIFWISAGNQSKLTSELTTFSPDTVGRVDETQDMDRGTQTDLVETE